MSDSVYAGAMLGGEDVDRLARDLQRALFHDAARVHRPEGGRLLSAGLQHVDGQQ
jgi:hypothetical protein